MVGEIGRTSLLTGSHEGPIFEKVRERIVEALEKLKAGLKADGGDLRLVDVSPDGTVRVALVGTCACCPLSRMLLQRGIEQSLKSIPEVKRVETVDERVER